ncbi:MAG: ABC transporter permease subunit [Actinomycetota bacterium]|nr:ABC transporter permease subunit [Actinomycetota bacterium]
MVVEESRPIPGAPVEEAKPDHLRQSDEVGQPRHRSRRKSIGLHLLLIGAALVALFPVVFIVSNSFTPENDILRQIDTSGSSLDQLKALIDRAIPDSLYLENYQHVLTRDDGIFFTWFRNSVLVATATTVFGVFIAATAGYAFSRYKFPGARKGLSALLVIQMFPGIILIVPLFNILRSLNVRAIVLVPALVALALVVYFFLRRLMEREWYGAIAYAVSGTIGIAVGYLLGDRFLLLMIIIGAAVAFLYGFTRRQRDVTVLSVVRISVIVFSVFAMITWALFRAPDSLRLLDNPWGLVFAYSSIAVPFSTYMLKGYFDTIPYSLEQAGMVDGLSPFGAFWRIAVPLAVPGLAVTAFFSFITAWNEFMFAFTFNLSSSSFTLPPGLQTFVSQFRTEWGAFSAAAVLVSVPALIVFFAAQRFLVGGLTAGGSKQ